MCRVVSIAFRVDINEIAGDESRAAADEPRMHATQRVNGRYKQIPCKRAACRERCNVCRVVPVAFRLDINEIAGDESRDAAERHEIMPPCRVTRGYKQNLCRMTACRADTRAINSNRPKVEVRLTPDTTLRLQLLPAQSRTTHTERMLRSLGGVGRPRSSISLRMSADVSGYSTADCTPTRTSPSA